MNILWSEVIPKLKNVKELIVRVPANPSKRPAPGDDDQAVEGEMYLTGWQAQCPGHNDFDEETLKPGRSLTVSKRREKYCDFHCKRGCSWGKIGGALGLIQTKKKEVSKT